MNFWKHKNLCRATNGSKISCPTNYQTLPLSKYKNVSRRYFAEILICHDIRTGTKKRQTMKRNNNSWRKSCKFHKNLNYTFAAILNFTKVGRFQLTRSSRRFDQRDGSY